MRRWCSPDVLLMLARRTRPEIVQLLVRCRRSDFGQMLASKAVEKFLSCRSEVCETLVRTTPMFLGRYVCVGSQSSRDYPSQYIWTSPLRCWMDVRCCGRSDVAETSLGSGMRRYRYWSRYMKKLSQVSVPNIQYRTDTSFGLITELSPTISVNMDIANVRPDTCSFIKILSL